MGTDVLTRPAKAKRSPEREALAAAIEGRDAAAERLRVAKEALSEFNAKLGETRSRHYEADDQLSEVWENLKEGLRRNGGDEAAAAADALRCGRPVPREAVRQAEEVYQRTKEALDLGKEGEASVKGAKLVAEDGLRWAERKVGEAAEKVCQTALPVLLARAEEALAGYAAAKGALAIVSEHLDGVHTNYALVEDSMVKRIRSLVLYDGKADTTRAIHLAGQEPWQAAHAALLKNADAELPK